jgi:hypothetical protein
MPPILLAAVLSSSANADIVFSEETCPAGQDIAVWVEDLDTTNFGGQSPTWWAWTGDANLTAEGWAYVSDVTEVVATVHCPPCPPGVDGTRYSVYVVAGDDDGNQEWEFRDIPLDCPDPDAATGCAAGGPGQSESRVGAIFALVAVLLARRRRARTST